MSKAAIVLFLLGATAGCSDTCSNKLVQVVKAPGGQHADALFQRDCGATTGFSTQVSVLTPGDKVSGGGNAFQADDDHGAAPVGEWQGSWAELRWLSADHLLIRYAAKSRVFKRDDQAGGVRISYSEVAH